MSKFNKNISTQMVDSYEGGKVFEKNPLEEWMNTLFSSYLTDKFYENEVTQTTRFIELTNQIIAKYGASLRLRLLSLPAKNLVCVLYLSLLRLFLMNISLKINAISFQIVNRPDDIAEILPQLKF